MPSPIPKPVSQVSAALAVLVTAAGVYWSLRSDPHIPFPTYLPHWLVAWTAHHGIIQNYAAYLILATLWFIAARNWRQRMAAAVALAGFAALAEIVQIWLPHRMASLADAACSWAGIATAWAFCRLGRRALRGSRPKNEDPRGSKSDDARSIFNHRDAEATRKIGKS